MSVELLEKEAAEQNAPLSLSDEEAAKIRRNEAEDAAFSKAIDKFFQNELKPSEMISIGNTPNALALAGAKADLELIIVQRTIAKCTSNPDKHFHGHSLDAETMKRLLPELRNPAMIFKGGKDNSMVVITELKDKENREIMIAVNVNELNKRHEVNRIASAYGRNNMGNYLQKQITQGSLIACNKEKANKMLQSAGLQLPMEETFISFDNSIAYTDRNVNTPQKKIEKENANMDDKDVLMQKLLEQLGANNEIVAALVSKINSLEATVQAQSHKIEAVTEKQDMFSSHLNQIYNAKSIEETLGIMSSMGKFDLEAQNCDVYNYDMLENKLFTVSEQGERVYINAEPNTPVGEALFQNKVFLENQYDGKFIGDGKDNTTTTNVAVIPVEAKTGEVIGVVVAKNKKSDFTHEDVGKFDLQKGNIGSAFRMGLENKSLKQAAVTDKLTHLHNRLGAQEFLKNTVLPNLKDGKTVSTIMIDIDKFKNFNDTYGHDIGDKALQQVSSILKSNIRAEDSVFRWGGEEMVVIANMDANEAYSLAERLRKSIQDAPLDVGDGKLVQITASMGVAQIVEDNPQRLNKDNIMEYFESKPLKRADERLYQAKENGRNQVVASQAVMSIDRREKKTALTDIKDIAKQVKNSEKSAPTVDKDKKHRQDLS